MSLPLSLLDLEELQLEAGSARSSGDRPVVLSSPPNIIQLLQRDARRTH